MYYLYVLLGILLRRQIFNVNEGNDDWRDLVYPEKYGLTQTQNFYIPVRIKIPKCSRHLIKSFHLFQFDDSSGDKIGGWFIRAKSVDDVIDEESCPKDGCPTENVLKNVPRLGPKDTVIVLLHGNAKVK